MSVNTPSYAIVEKLVRGKAVRFLAVADRHYSLDETPDRLVNEDVRRSIVPLPRFWDSVNARPRMQTPPAMDYAWSRRIPIANQGERPTCVSFALVAAMELAALRRGMTWELSEEFGSWLFNSDKSDTAQAGEGVSLLRGIEMLAQYGICPREMCKYDQGPPSKDAIDAATYGISEYALIDRLTSPASVYSGCGDETNLDGPTIANTSYLECIIASNHDIVITMATNAFVSGDVLDIEYAQPRTEGFFCTPQPPNNSHAMVMVGYNRIAPTPYFVFRDSSQADPALHMFYSYDFVRRYARYGVVVLGVSCSWPPPPRALLRQLA